MRFLRVPRSGACPNTINGTTGLSCYSEMHGFLTDRKTTNNNSNSLMASRLLSNIHNISTWIVKQVLNLPSDRTHTQSSTPRKQHSVRPVEHCGPTLAPTNNTANYRAHGHRRPVCLEPKLQDLLLLLFLLGDLNSHRKHKKQTKMRQSSSSKTHRRRRLFEGP